MKVASFNVNGLRARLEHVCGWLTRHEPDVLCLQETKVTDDEFPLEPLARLGYAVTLAGQRGYNGVAILARQPLTGVKLGLYDDGPASERRALSATVLGTRVVNVYVPNGKSVLAPSFLEKLRWLERLRVTLDVHEDPSEPLVLCGDFNVARDELDVFDPAARRGQLLFHPEERRALERVLDFGLVDTFRARHPRERRYSWWDYRSGDFVANRGLRLDYVFVTAPLAARLTRAVIDDEPRRLPKPSDHAPVLATFD